VPESVVGDVFLPESLRAVLGLKTNAARLARDAYLLHALVASRRAGGRVDVLLGKVSSAGDPIKPSRLLLQCADAELPSRVRHLFRALTSAATLPARERPWKLRPRWTALTGPLSPTAFRSYLACPFRFYLQHGLKMEAVDAEKTELDVFDFGRLCHKPLEKFAEIPWRDCTDERLLAAMLVEEFDRVARERFGDTPAVPLVAQLESGRQRLRWAAKVQAQQRADGWVVFAIEQGFRIELGGLTIKGRIDRIDRHESGAWRVIDYKTSDAPKSPLDAHLGPPREGTPDWTLWTGGGGKPRQWTDLQLPLYLEALPQIVPEARERAACGYFNLPKAVASTSVTLWHDYSIEVHESALRCAAGVVAAVRAGEFGPPNEKIRPENDAFAELFHRGVADSVEWEATP
jgi:ATP-dependent helicase/nuclease subunit B